MPEQFFQGKPAQLEYELEADPPVTVTAVSLTGYDSSDAVVSGLNAVAGGFTPTTEAAVILLSYGWTAPVLGHIRLQWTVTFSGGAQQTFYQEIEVVAVPPASRENTYDLTTTTGQTRFWALDTNLNAPRWTDPEINLALSASGDNPIDAAVLLLNLKALEFAEQAVVVKTQSDSVDLTKRAEQMHKRIEYLQSLPTTGAVVDPPTRVFVPDYDDGDPATTMDPW